MEYHIHRTSLAHLFEEVLRDLALILQGKSEDVRRDLNLIPRLPRLHLAEAPEPSIFYPLDTQTSPEE